MTAGTVWVALRALVYATGFVLLWAWLAYQAHLQDHRVGLWLPDWLAGIGLALMAAGAAVTLASVATFVVAGRGTPAPFDPPRRFVAVGLYRWVRNPMYLGGILLLLGYALCAGSVLALVVPVAMLGLAHLFVVLYEEPHLERRFGPSYSEYRRATPRWIPRPPR